MTSHASQEFNYPANTFAGYYSTLSSYFGTNRLFFLSALQLILLMKVITHCMKGKKEFSIFQELRVTTTLTRTVVAFLLHYHLQFSNQMISG